MLSNPHNPTGQVIHGEELERLVDIAREKGTTLILDEVRISPPSPSSICLDVLCLNVCRSFTTNTFMRKDSIRFLPLNSSKTSIATMWSALGPFSTERPIQPGLTRLILRPRS